MVYHIDWVRFANFCYAYGNLCPITGTEWQQVKYSLTLNGAEIKIFQDNLVNLSTSCPSCFSDYESDDDEEDSTNQGESMKEEDPAEDENSDAAGDDDNNEAGESDEESVDGDDVMTKESGKQTKKMLECLVYMN